VVFKTVKNYEIALKVNLKWLDDQNDENHNLELLKGLYYLFQFKVHDVNQQDCFLFSLVFSGWRDLTLIEITVAI